MKFSLEKTTTTTALLILAMQLFSQTFNIRFGRGEETGIQAECRSSLIHNDTIYSVVSEAPGGAGLETIYKITLQGEVIDTFQVIHPSGHVFTGWADYVQSIDSDLIFSSILVDTTLDGRRFGLISRYDTFGNKLWQKIYGDSIHNYYFYQLKPTSDGGIIAVGSAALTPSFPKFYVVKTDGDGNIEWEKYLGVGDKYRNGIWIKGLSNGEFLAAGFEDRTEYNPCGIIYRLSSSGNLLQTKKYPFWGLIDNQGVESPLEMPDGSIVFGTGKFDMLVGNNSDYRDFPQLVKVNGATLDTIWTCRIADTHLSGSTQVSKIAADGNIVCVGTYGWHYLNTPWTLGIISKVDTDGNLIWHRRHYHAAYGDNLLFDLDPLPNGGWLATGYTFLIANNGDPVTAKEAWLLALDEDGCLVPDCENLVYSVDEKNPIAFSVYPNPVQNDLNIALAHNMGNEEVLINVYDLQGRSVMQHQIQMNEGTLTLDASPLPSGTYFLSITVGGVTKTERLVRE
jgi:outer membrane protein assembly factor BamB